MPPRIKRERVPTSTDTPRERVPDKRRICGAVQGAHPRRRWRAINLQRPLPYKLSKIQPRFVHKGYVTFDFVLVEKITDCVNDFVVTRLTRVRNVRTGKETAEKSALGLA